MDPSPRLWFHGLVTRENAEKLLLECSSLDGTFLLRGSTSKVGNFVLSVVHKKKVNCFYFLKNKHICSECLCLRNMRRVVQFVDDVCV